MTTVDPAATGVDRPARIRAALRELVAEHGFHGASMSAVAKRAGVATGTAYVHYESKDELVLAAYVEVKTELSAAAVAGVDLRLPAPQRFAAVWSNIYDHLAAEPTRARFLLQVDASPYAVVAHERAMERPGDELAATMADVADLLVDLPPVLVFELAIGPAITSIASGGSLTEVERERLSACCWRAVTVPAD
ncbi:MAG: TetR/AcrR family transcriptional regulator [Actinomycetota bacterium]